MTRHTRWMLAAAAVLLSAAGGHFARARVAQPPQEGTRARGADGGQPADRPAEGDLIDRVMRGKGVWNGRDRVMKLSFPRQDVRVRVDGRAMEPFMGLTSWAAFTRVSEQRWMVMGDVVLMQDEVSAAMRTALEQGLAVTALHNHFLFDEPRVFFMHIGGEGGADGLGKAVRAVMDVAERPTAPAGPGAAARPTGDRAKDVPTASSIPAERVEAILGAKGQSKDGMFKAVLGRTVKMSCGCEVGGDMGVNTWVALAGSAEASIVDGDFVTFEGELQPVLKALTGAGLDVVAIHNHMEGETPRCIFLHYWGVGPAEGLARGVRAALDAQAGAHAHDK